MMRCLGVIGVVLLVAACGEDTASSNGFEGTEYDQRDMARRIAVVDAGPRHTPDSSLPVIESNRPEENADGLHDGTHGGGLTRRRLSRKQRSPLGPKTKRLLTPSLPTIKGMSKPMKRARALKMTISSMYRRLGHGRNSSSTVLHRMSVD